MATESRNQPEKTKSRKVLAQQTERPLSTGYLFRKVAREKISIEVASGKDRMSCWDAYVRQIYTMALNKDHGAARLLARLRKQFPGDLLPGDPIYFLIYEEDLEL
jgi:hypothetical protein